MSVESDGLSALQRVTRANPFIKSDLASRDLAAASHGWAEAGLTVRAVRGSKMRTEDQFFNEVSAALQFPYYFGENWPAFDECLADLKWLPRGTGYVFVVYEADQVLADAPSQAFATFEKVIHRACDEFSEPVDDGESWDRPATPFHLVIQLPGGVEGNWKRKPSSWQPAGLADADE
ncbi:barstar family protein [Nocardioides sp. NPDC000445]|uniref:barstar family protein n=1 Tax=Nocardioides sp. NPDC000445 TaxID=3154257 RepID=UPI0033291DDC